MFERQFVSTLVSRLESSRDFIQILMGPRQTGKSTAVAQVIQHLNLPTVEFSFDLPKDQKASVLQQVWNEARSLCQQNGVALLAIDEAQKVPNWSAVVKKLWDEDTINNTNLRVLITGSSSLLLKKGMSDSLKGRFELTQCTQWNYFECQQAFDLTFDEFLFFGGYPGALKLKDDPTRWANYLRNSIIEPTISQDILEMETVRKPALLRNLFEIGAVYSSQEVSYRKLLGQLDDKGNTDAIAHYLDLLTTAGMLTGLQKFSKKLLQEKASSPRLMVYDTALMTASFGEDRQKLRTESQLYGRLIETAVGSYLLNRSCVEGFNLFWWREGNYEVDFVVQQGARHSAIEVKSGRIKNKKGLGEFVARFPGTYCMIVGSDEFPVEDFLLGKVPLFQ